MSDKEKNAAAELVKSYQNLPDDGKEMLRTYLSGVHDGLKLQGVSNAAMAVEMSKDAPKDKTP